MDLELGVNLAYMVAIVLFAFGIKALGKVKTARQGNTMASAAMLIAVIAALVSAQTFVVSWEWIVAGVVLGALVGGISARVVEMTSMPEMVALLNGSGGAASFLVGLAALFGWAFAPGMTDELAAEATLSAAVLQPNLLVDAGGAGGVAAIQSSLAAGNLDAVATLGGGAEVAEVATQSAITLGLIGQIDGSAGPLTALALVLSLLIGGVTLTGSLVAYGKLSGRMSGNAIVFDGQHALNAFLLLCAAVLCLGLTFGFKGTGLIVGLCCVLTVLALLLGVLLTIPIGGADMPVVISLLNSYSGLAASMTGFVLQNNLLIVAGAMVGAAGLILTAIMCKAMNRSLLNVLLGGFGETGGAPSKDARDYKNIKETTGDQLAMMLDGVQSVIVVPGYGLAVAQAQHVVREVADVLEERGTKVRYAIHPVAGRMPGHMNVLLAEANVPYEQLVEMDEINPDFKNTDVVIVTGANDVVNPASLDEPDNPLYGMPILNTHEARNVVIIKRSLSPGYAGVKNKLFEADNAYMLFGDAKAALQECLDELKED